MILDVRFEPDLGKVVLANIGALGKELPKAVNKGLSRVAMGVHRAAFDWLSGPGAKASNVPGGGFPVPVRTGHLRRSLDWVAPGKTKSGNGDTFTAGPDEVIIYNSASYALAVHDGKGSSRPYGPRAFLDKAFEEFLQSGKALAISEDEVQKAIDAKGLG